MHRLKYRVVLIILVMVLLLASLSFNVFARPLVATPIILAASAPYSVLAGSGVINTGATTISGNVGIAPGTTITGFPPGIVGPPGVIHVNNANAVVSQEDNLKVFSFDLDQTCTQIFGSVDLTTTFPTGVGPGVYCSTGSFSLSGNLNLIGSGVWIFKTGTTLITSPGSSVTGGDPCNVWWRVDSSAALGASTSFVGNILARTDINLGNGTILSGRAFAQTGQVVLQSNIIANPICAVQPIPTNTYTTTPTGTATRTATKPATNTPTITRTGTLPNTPTRTYTLTYTPTAVPPTPTRLPAVAGLPGSGGAPIRSKDFPWSLVVAGGFGVVALVLGFRVYRRSYRSKQ